MQHRGNIWRWGWRRDAGDRGGAAFRKSYDESGGKLLNVALVIGLILCALAGTAGLALRIGRGLRRRRTARSRGGACGAAASFWRYPAPIVSAADVAGGTRGAGVGAE